MLSRTGKSSKKPTSARTPWFAVRRDLGAQRSSLLTTFSFLLPVAIWCLVSYCPFIWHPDVQLQIAANREDVNTTFTAGDRVSRDYFPEFQEAVRTQNVSIRERRAGGETFSSRANKKLLRQVVPIAIANGWLTEDQATDDEAIYGIWRDLATGEKVSTRPELTDENLAIARENWEIMSAASPTYDSDQYPTQPFAQMIPQGAPSNPDYLPPPHEVVVMGIKEFQREVDENQPSMTDRLAHSVKIVFGGFLISCLIGLPLGVLCGTYQFFSKLFEPFVDFFRYMPAPAFSTLLVALFAANDAPKVALVVVGTLFQMVLVIAKTTRLLDVSLLEAAQTLGAKQRQLVTKVVIPGIMPNLYNDLRILLGWAWTWLVIAELIGVKSGLTELIETQGRWRNFDRVFPVIILIGMMGFFTDQVLAWLHRILFPYAEGNQNRKPSIVGRAITWFPRWLVAAANDRLPPDLSRPRNHAPEPADNISLDKIPS
ncbi:MAG: ABC transporter permease [Verrucomicrobiae bacterium]|nr:ABC transporter permease [Verrucomicrobiae bacterium]